MRINFKEAERFESFEIHEDEETHQTYLKIMETEKHDYKGSFVKVNFSVNDTVYVWKAGCWYYVYAENSDLNYASWQAYIYYNKKQRESLDKEFPDNPCEDKIQKINELFCDNINEVFKSDLKGKDFWSLDIDEKAGLNWWRM